MNYKVQSGVGIVQRSAEKKTPDLGRQNVRSSHQGREEFLAPGQGNLRCEDGSEYPRMIRGRNERGLGIPADGAGNH
jgi:hypothetical protein